MPPKDTIHILQAFQAGVDDILGKTLLDEVGPGGDRLEVVHIRASDALLRVESVTEMTERIKRLGPNPVNGAELNQVETESIHS